MRRREFITLLGASAAWPRTVRAQRAERSSRVGILMGVRETPYTAGVVAKYRAGLAELGWTEGRNLHTDYRWTGGDVVEAQRFAQVRSDFLQNLKPLAAE